MLADLAYNDDLHEYRVSGQVVPSVTQILAQISAAEYRGVPADVMERAAALGKATHKVIELDVRGELDVESVSDVLLPYYRAWLNFRALSGFEPLASEQQVYSARYGYAGTLDLFGRLGNKPALIDAKRTAAVPRTAGPQTAGYAMALIESRPDLINHSEFIERYALHLRVDGTWRLVPFTDKADQRVFLACLTTHQWSRAA